MPSLDSFKSRKTLKVGAKTYVYYSLEAAAQNGLGDISRLPVSLKVLLENLLRFEDGKTVTRDDIKAFAAWLSDKGKAEVEIAIIGKYVSYEDSYKSLNEALENQVELVHTTCDRPPSSSEPIRALHRAGATAHPD